MTVTINTTSYAFKPGIVFKEKLSEDLDTATLVLPHITSQSFKIMDQVTIADTWTKYYLISSINRKTTKHDGTKQYTYILGLVSPTIQLQRIVLPNRAITQPISGTKTTIYTVLSHYVSMYAPGFSISSALQTLTNVDCPEFQWNRPTLFEVFNDLLSEVDAVVTMTDFTTISYLDLNPTGSEISDDDLAEVELNQSIEDYGNKIETEIENAIVNKANTRCVEWIALKTDADVLVTTDNAKYFTEKPIDKINSITAMWVQTQTTLGGHELDITARTIEKTQYDLMLPSNSLGVVSGSYKRDRIYYTKGSNTIDGVCYNEDSWLGTSTKKAIVNIIINAASEQLSLDLSAMTNSNLLDVIIKIDYQAQETTKLITNKSQTYTLQTNQTPITLVNNQDTSYVNFNAFAKKQQNTMNRLANPTLTITAKYDSVGNMPSLGDNYGSYKLAEREYSVYDDYVKFKGTLSENYVLKNLYTGLKQERRFTRIALDNEALESHHIKEYFFNLARNADDQVSINSNTLDSTLENYIFKFGEADEQIKLIHFKSDSNTDIGVTPSAYWTQNSILLTYKMQDNFSAGLQLDDTSSYLQNYVSYTDSDGKFTSFVFKLYKGYDFISESPQVTYPIHKIRALPKIDTALLNSSDLVFTSGTLTRYKDNREITVETIQFNFTHDTHTIYGDKFFSDSPITYTESTDRTLYVAYSASQTYSEGDQTAKGLIETTGTHLTYTKSNNDITISSPDSSITISELSSWAICDSDGNIYVAVNL